MQPPRSGSRGPGQRPWVAAAPRRRPGRLGRLRRPAQDPAHLAQAILVPPSGKWLNVSCELPGKLGSGTWRGGAEQNPRWVGRRWGAAAGKAPLRDTGQSW